MSSEKRQLRWSLAAAAATVLVVGVPCAKAADYVWIEAESLAQKPEGFKVAGWGNKQYLSGANWLFAAIDGPAAQKIPAEGIALRTRSRRAPPVRTTSGAASVTSSPARPCAGASTKAPGARSARRPSPPT